MLNEPAPVQCANRVSCGMHKQFVDDTIQELVKIALGSLVEWQGPRPLLVINGAGVVKNRTVLHCPEIWGMWGRVCIRQGPMHSRC